jgi:hypothetical protein
MSQFATTKLIAETTQGGSVRREEITARLVWISKREAWAFARQWRRHARVKGGGTASDMAEYGKLAAKRWRHLQAQGYIVSSLPELKGRIKRDPESELGIALSVMVTSARGKDQVAGFAFMRRTYINHLVLEFLSVSPRLKGAVKGTGVRLLESIAWLAVQIGADEVWGECTKDSQSFYANIKAKYCPVNKPRRDEVIQPAAMIQDHFHFSGSELQILAQNARIRLLR